MSLVQLVYVSRLTGKMTGTALEKIVADSSVRNKQRDVTGALLFRGKDVMQLLEGEEEAVTSLFDRISKDTRHSHVQILLRKTVRRRLFPEWGMALADLNRTFVLDRVRLTRLLDDIRAASDTSHHSVEARVLLNDFRGQIAA